jgi:DNA adenine methylase
MDSKIRPPFNRQGNKYRLLDVLLPLIPQHTTYVELFLGSGVLFFNKTKAKINVLNDLDKQVIDNLKLLKKASSNPDDYRTDLNTLPKIKSFYSKDHNNLEDQLLREKIITTDGFGGKPVKQVGDIYRSDNPFVITKHIQEYQDLLKGVKLLSADYETIVKKYDSPNTFFFIDPPYENADKTSGYAQSKDFDYERLYHVISNISGKFLLTINDSPYIRSLFHKRPFTIKPIKVHNEWPLARSKIRKELIIYNY